MTKSNPIRHLAFSLTLISAIGFTAPSLADSTANEAESAQQINAANQLLRNGEIDQAIEKYDRVATNKPHSDELKYNKAVAQYRKSDIPAATCLFSETAGSADASIAARSRYNLGNCLYATALQTAEKDKPAAIEQLRTAISHFRGSLRSMPDNEDARANIELAAELIRKLEDEQKQDQQKQDQQKQDQQKQDQQKQDQQKQDQQNQDQQKQDQQKQDQQKQNEQQQNQDQQQQDSQDSQSKDSKSNQQQDQERQQSQQKNDESKSEQEKSDQSKSDESKQNESKQNESQDKSDESKQPQPQETKQQDQSEEQANSQQNQTENPQPSQNRQSHRNDQQMKEDDASVEEQPQDNKPVPTGELTAADQDDNQQPDGSVAMVDPNAKDNGLMTKEEAMKMLQAVRDRDMLRRMRQQQIERARNVRVDRDW